jgi:hypothetical protein
MYCCCCYWCVVLRIIYQPPSPLERDTTHNITTQQPRWILNVYKVLHKNMFEKKGFQNKRLKSTTLHFERLLLLFIERKERTQICL